MIIVGLTGGIGSGKTYVSQYFKKLGIPVYYADDEAKKLMNNNNEVIEKITKLFGNKAYINNELNRKHIADIVFNDKSKLEKLNSIVHPAVKKHFSDWVKSTDSGTPYVIKEAAILFESKTNTDCKYTIAVSAPTELRIERTIKRDNTDRNSILNRISKQLTDKERNQMADFIIFTDSNNVEEQVNYIHKKIME